MKSMKLVNLTPHAISLANEAGEIVTTIPPSGTIARVATVSAKLDEIDGVPVNLQSFGEVSGIPEPEEGVRYITSTLVAQAARRPDVLAPDTGPTAVRKDGQVVAVRAFVAFVKA